MLRFGKLALVSLFVLGASAAHAQTNFGFTFTGATFTAMGMLTASDNGNSSFTATSGSMTLSGPGAGTYALIPNPNAPNSTTITSGGNILNNYDNQLFPSSDPLLDFSGIEFGTSGAFILNIYNSAGTYLLVEDKGSNAIPTFAGDPGAFSLTPATVPEPSSLTLLLVSGIGGAGLLLKRRLWK